PVRQGHHPEHRHRHTSAQRPPSHHRRRYTLAEAGAKAPALAPERSSRPAPNPSTTPAVGISLRPQAGAMDLEFEKYEATGNDFIVVRVPSPDALSPKQAMALCDRHFGVGADGVLLISPSAEGRARMTVLNADGSRPEMCGNGLRCAALAV